ncbi:exonuclease domain-containing protein [Devriesea agamarum]|uniref:exonuclease domain-containing protein n=1 Tax=Devriesea agamarum TaxID=472569 RepID=UPI00071DFA58|nr:exonuclease domain-containing protein [Devriesea agamarum]
MNATCWLDRPLLGFDTETTGTDVTSDRIVTAALVYSTGPGRDREVVATWLIDPGIPIPEAAQAVHHVTTEHARTYGQPPAAALDEMAALIAEALGDGTPLVAFNGSFDLKILEHELRRNNLPTVTDRLGHDIAPVVDPLVLDRSLDRFRKGKRTLSTLCELYGVTQNGEMHTADVDVSATLDVLRAMAAKHTKIAQVSLDELHREQVSMHRAWAENFNNYLRQKGKPADVEVVWPL